MTQTLPVRPSDLVAAKARTARKALGWSGQQLADRCAETGAPELTAAVVANIETGRRDRKTGQRRREVTVEELLALARALGVSPGWLLQPLLVDLPRPGDDEAERLRAAMEAALEALRQFQSIDPGWRMTQHVDPDGRHGEALALAAAGRTADEIVEATGLMLGEDGEIIGRRLVTDRAAPAEPGAGAGDNLARGVNR